MRRRAALAASAVSAALVLTAACSGGSSGAGAVAVSSVPVASSTTPATVAPSGGLAGAPPPSRAALLHPKKKYFGVSELGAPQSLAGYRSVSAKVHKAPNVLGYFLDWTHPFDVAANQQVCRAGAVPSLTWESWSWENQRHGSPAVTQPKYAPRRIASGSQDRFIRRTARRIRQVHCPVMLRLDQEMNGHWYPWGLGTPGMHNKPADYVRMWRHVWKVFHAAHVHNVIWVWSPNYLYKGGIDKLGPMYPGNRYVDMVGIDGYLINPGDTPGKVFGPVMRRLRHVAPHRPWFVAETGAPDDRHQPARIAALVRTVANTKRLIGFSYLDQSGSRANWTFRHRAASVAAFRHGVSRPVFGRS